MSLCVSLGLNLLVIKMATNKESYTKSHRIMGFSILIMFFLFTNISSNILVSQAFKKLPPKKPQKREIQYPIHSLLYSNYPNYISTLLLQENKGVISETIATGVYKPPPPPVVHNTTSVSISSNNPQYGSNYSAQLIGQQVSATFGWVGSQWADLDTIIEEESGWNPNAINSSSGACGLGQQMPCSGLNTLSVSEQVTWVCNYILSRYQTPSNALYFHNIHGWY